MKKTGSSTLEPIKDYSRLTASEIALILRLAETEKTQREIAQVIGCAQPTVCKVLNEFQDTRSLAKHRTANAALRLAEAAIDGSIKAANDCKPEHALELLDRLGVAEKRQASAQSNQVNIVIGMPGQPAGPRPTVLDALSPPVTEVIHSLTTEGTASDVS